MTLIAFPGMIQNTHVSSQEFFWLSKIHINPYLNQQMEEGGYEDRLKWV